MSHLHQGGRGGDVGNGPRVRGVYFAQCIGFPAIKIGCSYGFKLRLEALQSKLPFDLQYLGSFPGDLFTERYIQVLLMEHRLGGEFYADSPPVREWAEHAKRTGEPLHAVPQFNMLHRIPGDRLRAWAADHGINVHDVASLLGVSTSTAKAYTKKQHGYGSLFLAALAVLARRRGADISMLAKTNSRAKTPADEATAA